MVFPNPYPSPPELESQAPSPLRDAPKEDDWMTQWAQAQVGGYVQSEPGDDGTNFDFASLDTLFPWQPVGTLPAPTPGSQLERGNVSIFFPTIKGLTNSCHRVSTGPPW